jgi:hypothetical protein
MCRVTLRVGGTDGLPGHCLDHRPRRTARRLGAGVLDGGVMASATLDRGVMAWAGTTPTPSIGTKRGDKFARSFFIVMDGGARSEDHGALVPPTSVTTSCRCPRVVRRSILTTCVPLARHATAVDAMTGRWLRSNRQARRGAGDPAGRRRRGRFFGGAQIFGPR